MDMRGGGAHRVTEAGPIDRCAVCSPSVVCDDTRHTARHPRRSAAAAAAAAGCWLLLLLLSLGLSLFRERHWALGFIYGRPMWPPKQGRVGQWQ
jgi:hypothetical protein